MRMIEKMAWNTFKNTGNINTFLELKQVENIELNTENMKSNVDGEIDGAIKNQGDCISRK